MGTGDARRCRLRSYHVQDDRADVLLALDADLAADVRQPEGEVRRSELLDQPYGRTIDRLVDEACVPFLWVP